MKGSIRYTLIIIINLTQEMYVFVVFSMLVIQILTIHKAINKSLISCDFLCSEGAQSPNESSSHQ